MRTFLALDLEQPVVDALHTTRERFVAADPSWCKEKWVRDENLHVTLRFLGNIPDPILFEIRDVLSERVREISRFECTFGQLKAVPRLRSASMIWAIPTNGHKDIARLVFALNERVDALFALHYESPDTVLGRDQHQFQTHVTLCRARRSHPVSEETILTASKMLTRFPVSMSVRTVTLYASTLTRIGPVYESIAEIPLGE